MNRYKNSVLTLFFIAASLSSFAQKDVDFDRQPSFKDRVFFGGGLGFSTGANATFVSLSPVVGYMITSQLSAGVGVDYQYVKFKVADISDSRYGGSVFTRYNFEKFFLHGEYNALNYGLLTFNDTEQRRTVTRVLLGGGVAQPLGRVGKLNIVGLYDVAYDANGPFSSPWVFRVFFTL